MVACAAIAVSWLGAGTVQSGLQSQLESKFKSFLDSQKAAEKAVLDSNVNLVESLTGVPRSVER
jgi:hypothetical protein